MNSILQSELQQYEEQLDALKAEKAGITTYEIIGMIVTHKNFGEGIVTNCDGNHMTIEFSARTSEFQIPQSFETGFLMSEYPDFLQDTKHQMDIDKKIVSVEKEINERKEQLAALII